MVDPGCVEIIRQGERCAHVFVTCPKCGSVGALGAILPRAFRGVTELSCLDCGFALFMKLDTESGAVRLMAEGPGVCSAVEDG
jgi:hypothetical protein